MKHAFLRGLCALLCLSLLLPLAACNGGGEPKANTLTSPAPGSFVCTETGVTYHRTSFAYLPGRMQRAPYAIYRTPGGQEQCFFALGDTSAGSYLVLADRESYYPYFMIVAEGYEMPSLAALDPNIILICNDEEEYFWHDANVFDRVRLADRVGAVVAAWTQGADTTLPDGEPLVSAFLIFAVHLEESEPTEGRYTEFTWYCSYYSFGPGQTYLSDDATGRTVRVADSLLEGYALSAGMEGGAENG